jgi:hypothetical protein
MFGKPGKTQQQKVVQKSEKQTRIKKEYAVRSDQFVAERVI